MVKFSRINVRTLAENGRLRAIPHNYVGTSFRVTTCISSCSARILLRIPRFWSLGDAVFGECLRCLNSQNCQFLIQLPHPLLPADIKLEAQMVLLQRFGIVCLRVQPCRGKKKNPVLSPLSYTSSLTYTTTIWLLFNPHSIFYRTGPWSSTLNHLLSHFLTSSPLTSTFLPHVTPSHVTPSHVTPSHVTAPHVTPSHITRE